MTVNPIRILFIGDIVGRPGRNVIIDKIAHWRKQFELDVVLANAENASGGNGLTTRNAGELFDSGVDFLTGGNHIWKQKDYPDMFKTWPNVIRPANYPDEVPGKGWSILEFKDEVKIGVMNLQGRVFMDPIDCPFRKADEIVEILREETSVIIVDMHAEATSEKVAMGYYLDGRVSAVMGTHTHVQSADERILPGGTAYMTDLGMTGPRDGVLGVDAEAILKRFITGLPVRFSIAMGPTIVNSAIISIDPSTGNATGVERFQKIYDSPRERES